MLWRYRFSKEKTNLPFGLWLESTNESAWIGYLSNPNSLCIKGLNIGLNGEALNFKGNDTSICNWVENNQSGLLALAKSEITQEQFELIMIKGGIKVSCQKKEHHHNLVNLMKQLNKSKMQSFHISRLKNLKQD